MSELKLTFSNYGNLNESFEIPGDARILLISGKNEVGKSTLKTAFNEAFTQKAIKRNPVTKGKESGWYELQIPDKEGNIVTIRHDFSLQDSKGTFTIVDHTGKGYKTVNKIKAILGDYNAFSIDDLFSMAKTPEGTRNLIAKLIYSKLSEDDVKRIGEIDEDIEPEKGGLYMERRMNNKEIEGLKTSLKMYELTPEEQGKLENEELAKTQIDNLLQKRKTYEDSILIKHQIDQINEAIRSNERTIKQLEDQVAELKEKNIRYKLDIEKIEKENNISEMANFNIDDLRKDIENGYNFLNSVLLIKDKKHLYDITNDKLNKAFDESARIANDFINLKAEKVKILSKVSLPNSLTISNEGEIQYKGLPFLGTEVSRSQAHLALAELKCAIEDARLLDLGEAALYDKKSMNEIIKLAKKYNKLVILEQVTDSGEVEIECKIEE